jgi:hypothetical protein
MKSIWGNKWKFNVSFKGGFFQWSRFIKFNKMVELSDEDFEKDILDKWSRDNNNDKGSNKGLFSCGNSILQVHGCIHKENVIFSINPSCQFNQSSIG